MIVMLIIVYLVQADSSPTKTLSGGISFKTGGIGLQTPSFKSGSSAGNSPFKMGTGLGGITALKPQVMASSKPQISFKFKGQTKPLNCVAFRKKSSPSSSSSRSRSRSRERGRRGRSRSRDR